MLNLKSLPQRQMSNNKVHIRGLKTSFQVILKFWYFFHKWLSYDKNNFTLLSIDANKTL